MYKRMSIDDLLQVQTWFFERLRTMQSKEWHMSFLWFLKFRFADANRIYIFEKNRPYMRFYCSKEWVVRIVDETEKIDISMDKEWMERLHNILKDTWKMRSVAANQSMLEQLLQEYREGKHRLIAWKPYLVYDIETTLQPWNPTHFEMSYDIASGDDHTEALDYTYVDQTTMKALADRLLAYDWWIIGYNNISFDNPVLLKNCWYTQEQIDLLNEKSLDPFVLFQKLTWRRMSLSNVASALIGAWKTLSSWMEWEELLKKYKETGDEKTLRKVKEYCRNDVEITLWVVLYLLAYKKVHFDGVLHDVDETLLLQLWTWDGATESRASDDTKQALF